MPLKVFICAASQDYELCDELVTHLAPLEYQELIELVDDRDLALGGEEDAQRVARVGQAAVVLLMLSPALLRGLRRNVMVQEVLRRHVANQLTLIPVLLRPADWKVYSFGNLVALPRDGRALTERGSGPASRDAVWVAIAKELRLVVEKICSAPAAPPQRSQGHAAAPAGGEKGLSEKAGRFRQGHALIIGTGDPGIEVTERDAQALHALLVDESKAGYPAAQARLLVGAKATRTAILQELDALVARVNQDPDGDTTVLIYFSGHGLRSEGSPPNYFLIPHGYAVGAEATTAISGSEFSERIAAIKSRKLMVFLDCCHAAGVPKAPGLRPAAIPPDLERQLGLGSGLVIVASSRDDEKSYTATPYSVFTACLMEALGGRGSTDQYARVLNVLAYLMQEVPRRHSQQHPVVKKMLDLGENFAVCYHGQREATEAVSKAPESTESSQAQRKRNETELSGLRQTEEIYIRKLTVLRNARATTADPMQQFQLDQNILDAEKEVAAIEERIEKLLL